MPEAREEDCGPPHTRQMNRICPDEIMRLANHDTIVRIAVDEWRRGRMTWESAMQWAVFVLAEKCECLERNAVTEFQNRR